MLSRWVVTVITDSDLGKQIGAIIKRTRLETGWSQRKLSERLGCSKSAVQRLEAGATPYVDIRLAGAAFRLLGIRMKFDAGTLGLANRREQRDLVHATCLGYVARRLRSDRWDVQIEVEIGDGRYRGWIDLLAYRALDRSLLCIEVKTEIDDLGRIQRTLGWYAGEAPIAARALGWQPASTTSALLLLFSTANDRAIQVNRELLRSTVPTTARVFASWIRSPGPAPASALALIDPRSRRAAWLRSVASEGRPGEAPYANYAAAAEIIRGRT